MFFFYTVSFAIVISRLINLNTTQLTKNNATITPTPCGSKTVDKFNISSVFSNLFLNGALCSNLY